MSANLADAGDYNRGSNWYIKLYNDKTDYNDIFFKLYSDKYIMIKRNV